MDELSRSNTQDLEDDDDDDDDGDKPEQVEKRKKRHRLARLKRKTKMKAYEFNGLSDIAGVLFLEIQRITDLPPERNSENLLQLPSDSLLTRSSDQDFVRHGSIRRHLAWKEDVSHSCCQAQPQPCL